MEQALQFYAKMDSYHRKTYNVKVRKQMSNIIYAVGIMKRTTGSSDCDIMRIS